MNADRRPQSRRKRITISAIVFPLVFLLIPRAESFATCHTLSFANFARTPARSALSSSALHGFRSSIREKISSIRWWKQNSSSIAPASEDFADASDSEFTFTVSTQSPPSHTSSSPLITGANGAPTFQSENSTADEFSASKFSHSAVETVSSPFEVDYRAGPIYSLPPLGDRHLTKLEKEFRDMLGDFAHFTPHDIESLRDPRMRTLFEGVAASAGCPPVYRAFEVLYEDLYPLRVAGRLVYSRLQQLMIDSQAERDQEVRLVVQKTGLEESDVETTRLAFVSVAARLNGDAFLTKDQLRDTGLTETAMHVLGFESVDDLLDNLCSDQSDSVNFVDMMIGLQETAESVCGIERCNPAQVMREIMLELKEHPPVLHTRTDSKRQQYSDHYDAMLCAFKEWESLVPQGEGRRLDVVRGCFVGAKNTPVVEALRIVYVDYAALRVAGDIIFKLVKGVMSAAASRQRNRRSN